MSVPPLRHALTSLSIRNFRGIESLDLDFRAPDGEPNRLVVLAGPNGCGKTAVLEAAMTVLGHTRFGRDLKSAVRKGAHSFEITATARAEGLDGLTYKAESFHTFVLPYRIPYWSFSSHRVPGKVGAVDVAVAMNGKSELKDAPKGLKTLKTKLVTAAAAERFPREEPPQKGYSQWMASINEGWKKLNPDYRDEFRVELVTEPSEEGGAFDVYFVRDGGPAISVDLLSSGQIELFMLLSSLSFHGDHEGIVFIDEPELHIDSDWHAVMLRLLMRMQPKAQFIVATHSRAIYAAALSYERHFLVPDKDPRAKIWPRPKSPTETVTAHDD